MTDRRFLRVVEGAIKGKKDSFDELMYLRGKNILYIALSLMHNPSDGEDAAQDAIIRIRRDIGQLQNPKAFDVWMYRVVYNTCMDAKKRMKRASSNIDNDSQELILEDRAEFLPEDYVDNEEKRNTLLAAIKELPDRYRMCLLMFYYEEMSYSEIADVMDLSEQDVANALNRAKKKLRAQLVPVDELLTIEDNEKTHKKAGFAALPVLAQVFAIDEQMSITPAMLNTLFSGAGVTATATASAGVSGSSASSAGSSGSATSHIGVAAKPLVGVAGKVVIGVAAVATATAIGVGAYTVLQGDSGTESPQIPSADQQIPADPQEEERDKEKDLETEGDDETTDDQDVNPEDVIGSPQAQQLRNFSSETHSEDEWDNFVNEAALIYTAETLDANYRYTLYYADSSDSNSRLIVIERLDNSGNVLVAYGTGSSGTVLPNRTDIVDAFKAWR